MSDLQLITTDQTSHEVLRNLAKEVTFPLDQKIKKIINDMREFIEALPSPFGKPAGLAAPQVGYPYQIIFFQIPPEAKKIRKDVFDVIPLTVLINPSYSPIRSAGTSKDWEGCYSVNDKMGEVHRYSALEFTGYTLEGEKIVRSAYGFLARVIQHEIDHLNGQLYIDLITDDCRFGGTEEMLPIRKAEIEKLNQN